MFHGNEEYKTNVVWHINRHIFEINVTNMCNLRCPNCQACVGIAPDFTHISLKHVEKFIEDAISLKCCWDTIKLTGGEPTLHPQFKEIVFLLDKYRLFNRSSIKKSGLRIPVCQFKLLTNGTNSEFTKGLPKWLKLQNQNSIPNKIWNIFESFNVSPIDTPEYKDIDKKVFRQLCSRVTKCGGCALGADGLYYSCEVSYHVDRVFDLKTGVTTLKQLLDATDNEARDRLAKCCMYCGYFKYPRDVVTKQVVSPSWKKAIEKKRKIY